MNLSVLVAVTGAWTLPKYRTDKHAMYLDIILSNYVSICEAGFRPVVVLITGSLNSDQFVEEGTSRNDSTWISQVISSSSRRCHRINDEVKIEVSRYKIRSLPPDSNGPHGDLAIRHRELFVRERNNFDLFISQENDVRITSTNLLKFVSLQRYLITMNEHQFHPALYMFEQRNGHNFVDWRLRQGDIYKIGAGIFFETNHVGVGCCTYIVVRSTLHRLIGSNLTAWYDPKNVHGEFNPAVASWNVLQKDFKVVFQLSSCDDGSGFHHMPNSYIPSPENRDLVVHRDFGQMTFQELVFIHKHCVQTIHENVTQPGTVSIQGDDCRKCLMNKKKAKLRTTMSHEIPNAPSASRRIHAHFQCVK
mmetsp:Transcript_4319/g.15216  ORF Transcript_4319/g.15216 Transcript_4319/m.15216 type:complete len:362 (-) Transcript_4319:211-1296(-)